MKLRIEMDCDNVAFEPFCGEEIDRILHDLGVSLSPYTLNALRDMGPDLINLHDSNGNRVGTCTITDE